MTDADLLREASDPTTPGERLRELWWWDGAEEPEPYAPALARNPSLPLDILRRQLRHGNPDAWRNPVVPALLMAEPLPVYREAAEKLLKSISPWTVRGMPLPDLVAWWAEFPRPTTDRGRALARHLAGLFSLPWPAP
jgi:hypothetical protein